MSDTEAGYKVINEKTGAEVKQVDDLIKASP
jgi:uncharacterized protein YrrD